MQRNAMVQWMNLHQNNSFINRIRLPLFCEISGAIHLVLMGLMAGRQAGGRQAGRQAGRQNLGKFQII